MKSLDEWKPTTSPYEVLSHLNDKILTGELLTFESLRSYASRLPDNQGTAAILRRAFELQKKLHWGFFRGISAEQFPRVWSEVVLPDRKYRFAGDLKRFMSIPDIYMALLDIHGYTRFCHRHRGNVSMLDLLDTMMQEVVPRLVAKVGVVSRRAHGDEILLLGPSAQDILEATILVMDYFSTRRRVSEDLEHRKRNFDVILPGFQLSAGIAGGQKYTPLIITKDGDLSGDIVNTAARLQSRAGRISPDRNKILITSHVYQRLRSAEDKQQRSYKGKIDYFNTGTVEFKGLSLAVYDIVFLPAESYRIAYRETMEELYESLDHGLWKSKVFEDAVKLVTRIAMSLPELKARDQRAATRDLSRNGILGLAKSALDLFLGERFERAIGAFGELVQDLASLQGMDELALDYLGEIHRNYLTILSTFVENLDREVDEHPDSIYGPAEKRTFLTLKKHHAMFDGVREAARMRVKNRKAVWYRVAEFAAPQLEITIQSKK
ncbi:MAG TPA: adenylate/guanylate cyclase domain-containing protein [Rectinemataceae bacterium]|nr:adenylate/guanylate cyclase domain-containing protein [Rectinemataceae bacterium]